MKIKIILLYLVLSVVCYNSKSQTQNEIIDKIIKIRSDYVMDSIPEVFREWYKPLTYSGNKQFYDTLKSFLPEIPFAGNTFYWLEYIADDRSSKNIALWTDSFNVRFICDWIPRWDRVNPWDDSIIYKFEVRDNHREFLRRVPFLNDYEEWNENVTNRSYLYWAGSGGSLDFCSKITFDKSDIIEIKHSVFCYYNKDTPLFYLKEQPEDDYQPRLQINCDYITDEKSEEFALFSIGYHVNIGRKIFDCEGNVIEFEYIEE